MSECCNQDCNQGRDCPDHKELNMKPISEKIKKGMLATIVILLVGFSIGYFYTWNTVLLDCKVLGMTRYGSTPVGCRIGATS